MKKYCYTWFFVISVAAYTLWAGVHGYQKPEESIDVPTNMERVCETEKQTDTEGVYEAERQTDMPQGGELGAGEQSEIAGHSPNGFPDGFEGVLFIGDSRTVGLYEYGRMGEADVFADSGMSVFNLWDRKISLGQKEKKHLEQLLAGKQYQIIHFMLGINELGYSMEQIVEKYREAVKKVQKMQPDAKVVLGANLHVTLEKSEQSTIYNNGRIDALNYEIQKIGKEQECYFINVNELFDDEQGNLSAEYSADGSHILGKYYADWVQWLIASNFC